MDDAGRMTMAELNAASDEEFRAALAGIWEHSPWIVEAVRAERPFDKIETLLGRMWVAVITAGEERQVSLLNAHPDLAGKFSRAGALTAESTAEQASAGLDRLTRSELAAFNAWNERYRQDFGFPFIICVRDHSKNTIRKAFRRRLARPRGEEIRTALEEVRKIAEYRLRDRLRP